MNNKCPTMEDIPIINSMDQLQEIDNDYNKGFLMWLIIMFTSGSTIVAVILLNISGLDMLKVSLK